MLSLARLSFQIEQKSSFFVFFSPRKIFISGAFLKRLIVMIIYQASVVSYWRKDVHLVLVNRLGSLPRNSVVRLTDRLDMTIVDDWNVNPQIKQIGWSE